MPLLITSFHFELALDAVEPSVGDTAGGSTITLTGKQFEETDDDSELKNLVYVGNDTIGWTLCTGVEWVNESTLTAVTPAGTAGAVSVRVDGPSGQSKTLVDAFTYMAIIGMAPDFWVRRPDYEPTTVTIEGLGEWEAEVGADLYGLDSFSLPAPYTEIGGGPVFAITPPDAPYGNLLYNVVTNASWYGDTNHSLFAVTTPAEPNADGYTTDANAPFNPLIVGAYSGAFGITFHRAGGHYFLTYYEYDDLSGAGPPPKVRIDLGTTLPGEMHVQSKKEAGLLWLRNDDDDWVSGDACGDMSDELEDFYGGGAAVGFFTYLGSYKTIASWKRAVTDDESDVLATVAA